MIVFTAKNLQTNDIFVGSARDSVEEQWGRLTDMADAGGEGPLLDSIRAHDAENFTIETYDYADTPSEARELVREASETLGAQVIRTGKNQAPKAVPDNSRQRFDDNTENTENPNAKKSSEELSREIEAFLAAKKANTPQEKNVAADTKTTESVTTVRDQNTRHSRDITKNKTTSLHSNSTTNSRSSRLENRATQKEHGPVTQVDIKAYLASQNNTSNPTSSSQTPSVALRKTDSTQEAEDMKAVMMSIEMKRRQNRQSASTAKPKKKATKQSIEEATEKLLEIAGASKKTNSSIKGNAKKDKLPDGRVSSSAKEKRIKEAIAQERLEREAAQAAKVAAEAKEMAEIMAKLDQKTKEKERIRRRR